MDLELLGEEPDTLRFGLLTPREPLEPGVSYAYDGSDFVVEDFIDASPPEPGQVRKATFSSWEDTGCTSSSCGDNAASIRMHLVSGTDDHTASAALTYAVYLGVTSEEAATTTRVERFVAASQIGEAWFGTAYEWTERDLYLSVSTLDLSGNESPLRAPIRIHAAPSGCRVAGDSGLQSFVWLIAAITWHVVRRQRVTRRMDA